MQNLKAVSDLTKVLNEFRKNNSLLEAEETAFFMEVEELRLAEGEGELRLDIA